MKLQVWRIPSLYRGRVEFQVESIITRNLEIRVGAYLKDSLVYFLIINFKIKIPTRIRNFRALKNDCDLPNKGGRVSPFINYFPLLTSYLPTIRIKNF